MQLIDAIVLAGAVNKGKLRACSKAEYEAMIDINKKMLVEYVVGALIKVDRIKKFLVVGPSILERIFSSDDVLVIDAKGSLIDNVCAALDSLNLYSAKKAVY
ncbi:hypothetical protein M1N06_04140 [Peptococcaceae bacterium]|nr:hypothetical protein [Peptococcaceae bacterium]